MSHPIVKAAFIAFLTAWILWWVESHSIVVTTTADVTGATTTVVDLVYAEVEEEETPTPTPTP